MKTITFSLALMLGLNSLFAQAQRASIPPAKVDYDAFEKLTAEVKQHRKTRLLNLDEFLRVSKEEKVLILDTRSDAMYASKHIKGAVHLNFSDFTQDNLASVIPDFNTKILIYCNNNFEGDEVNFASKEVVTYKVDATIAKPAKVKPITLALNIPTYINLYGYGYRNVFELSELVSVDDKRVEFEGTSVKK